MSRRGLLDEAGLERALSALAREVAFPETPDLAGAVRARIEAAEGTPQLRDRTRLRWAILGAAALVLVAGLAVALSPAARDAVADWLGLGGIRIRYAPSPRPTSSTGRRLALGAPSTLEGARAEVDFDVILPSVTGLGSPDAVYVSQVPPGGRVSLVYGPRAGLPETSETGAGMIVTEWQASIDGDVGEKVLGAESDLVRTTVGGRFALWIEGPHAFYFYRDKTGRIREDTLRFAANTLLWERDGVTLRIESDLGLEATRRIAESMR